MSRSNKVSNKKSAAVKSAAQALPQAAVPGIPAKNNNKRKPSNNSIVKGKRKDLNASFEVSQLDILNNAIFDTPEFFEKDSSKGKIKYTTQMLWYRINDNTVGKIQIELPRLYCFGISTYEDTESSTPSSSHSLTLCLGPKEGADETTNSIVSKLDDCATIFQRNLDQNSEALNLYGNDLQMKKMLLKPIYKWKTDKGVRIGSPTLNVKLWESSYDPATGNKTASPRVFTVFYDGLCVEKNGDYRVMKMEDELISDTDRQIPFFARATIQICSAFIGTAICNYKVILKEAVVFKTSFKPVRLMAKPKHDDLEFSKKLREEMKANDEPNGRVPDNIEVDPEISDNEENEESDTEDTATA